MRVEFWKNKDMENNDWGPFMECRMPQAPRIGDRIMLLDDYVVEDLTWVFKDPEYKKFIKLSVFLD